MKRRVGMTVVFGFLLGVYGALSFDFLKAYTTVEGETLAKYLLGLGLSGLVGIVILSLFVTLYVILRKRSKHNRQ